jgi:histone H3/H4
VCRRYQKSTDLLIRKLPFQRLVREVSFACSPVRKTPIAREKCVGRLPKISRTTCGSNPQPSWHCKRQPKHTWYKLVLDFGITKRTSSDLVCAVCAVCRFHCLRTRTCAPFMPVECTRFWFASCTKRRGVCDSRICLFVCLVRSTIMPKDIQLYVTTSYLMHHSHAHALTRACPAQSPANSRRAFLTARAL